MLLNKVAIAAVYWVISWMLLKEIGEYVGLGINRTSSQIPGVYAYFPIKLPLRRGDLVDFYLDFSDISLGWIKYRKYIGENEKLLKNIGAISGDRLYTIYPNIYACKDKFFKEKCRILGICMQKDKNGYQLFCQNWHGIIIPNDYFYLQSNRVSNSFDSRYFGLINIKNIRHRLKIIWKL